jgi:DNA-binding NarL/FixJ family response regulator
MIRVLMADDHQIVREGLKRIIAECPDMQVVAEAVDGNEAIVMARQQEDADVMLLDVSMPGPGFLETMKRIRNDRPDLRVLVLSVHPEDHYAVRALRSGASGYLTKDHSPDELAAAIRRVHTGRKYVTAALAERLAVDLDPAPERPPHELLSNREFEVLLAIVSGKSIKEVAATKNLSPKTVSTYRTRILKKLDVTSNADLVRYAIEHKLGENA